MNKTLVMLATVTALAGCGKPATEDSNGTALTNDMIGNAALDSNVAMTNAMASPVPDAPIEAVAYLAKAGAGDMFEVESSKAVLAKSTNADAKMFAQMMIEAHSKSTETLKSAAKTDGVAVSPPALDPLQEQMLNEIKAAPADKIDAVYYAHQSKAHAAALALHQRYAAQGDKPALKKAAAEMVPVVETHIAELGKLTK